MKLRGLRIVSLAIRMEGLDGNLRGDAFSRDPVTDANDRYDVTNRR